MKGKTIYLFMTIFCIQSMVSNGQSFSRNTGESPKFVPKYAADKYMKVKVKQNKQGVLLKWQFTEEFDNKTVHILKGVVGENEQIQWKIIEQYELLNTGQKFDYLDENSSFEKAYYRLRISEDGDQVEYTSYYLIEKS